MKILDSAQKISKNLRIIRPTHVAVAFIGNGYMDFIDIENIESIVVSPTIGSNPEAIGDLVEKIGWEKVYFLDELHAKLYIGDENSIISSSNLSNNGLSGKKNVEVGVLLKTTKKNKRNI